LGWFLQAISDKKMEMPHGMLGLPHNSSFWGTLNVNVGRVKEKNTVTWSCSNALFVQFNHGYAALIQESNNQTFSCCLLFSTGFMATGEVAHYILVNQGRGQATLLGKARW
jgi:hypothetical protein